MMDCSLAHLRVCCCNQQTKIALLLITCVLYGLSSSTAFTITGKDCKQNVSVKYQESVMRTTQPVRRSVELDKNEVKEDSNNLITENTKSESYVTYEPRVRWETKTICCPGYRTLLLGFCEPICETKCPPFSYCATPNQCECLAGYEEHHPNDKEKILLDCRPICSNGCPRHSQCVARNQCRCRAGYMDTSGWLMPMKCQRIRCAGLDQRYDAEQKMCVKIDMSMEELMKKVAARLTKGLADEALENGEDGDEDEEDAKEDAQNEVVKGTRKEVKNNSQSDT